MKTNIYWPKNKFPVSVGEQDTNCHAFHHSIMNWFEFKRGETIQNITLISSFMHYWLFTPSNLDEFSCTKFRH